MMMCGRSSVNDSQAVDRIVFIGLAALKMNKEICECMHVWHSVRNWWSGIGDWVRRSEKLPENFCSHLFLSSPVRFQLLADRLLPFYLLFSSLAAVAYDDLPFYGLYCIFVCVRNYSDRTEIDIMFGSSETRCQAQIGN